MQDQEVETLEAQVRLNAARLAAAAAVATSRKACRAAEAKERGRGFLCQCSAPPGPQLSVGIVPSVVQTAAASWL